MSGINVPQHFIEEYTSNVAHLLQYRGGKLEGSYGTQSYQSNGGVIVDQYAAVDMSEVVSRFAPMPRTDGGQERVWIYPRDYDLSQQVDTFDELRLMTDPKGPIAESSALGAARKKDVILFDAFYADIKKGVDGSTTESFDTTNHRVDAAIGAAADTGLNVEKVIDARRILQDNEVDLDMEDCWIAITPTQEQDLLRQDTVIDSDKNRSLGIVLNADGRIRSFAGCRVVCSTRVPSNASYRLCPMWVKSGMHLGVWSDISARVDPRPDIQGIPWQIYTTMSMAASRVEAGRVIQIECTE